MELAPERSVGEVKGGSRVRERTARPVGSEGAGTWDLGNLMRDIWSRWESERNWSPCLGLESPGLAGSAKTGTRKPTSHSSLE